MLFIKRVILVIVSLAVVAFAITMSGLNTEKVVVNLYFFSYELSLGFVLILTLFLGLLTGLFMALFSFYLPLKSQLNKTSRKNRQLLSQLRQTEQADD